MPRITVDVWEFWFNHGYGNGWECEAIETTRAAMLTNRRTYREAGYEPRIRKRRVHRDKVATHDPVKP